MQHKSTYRGFMVGLLSLGVLIVTLAITGPAQAVDSNGPYYATPSWDQKLPATTRFVVLTDWGSAAVLDRNTGLVWERTPATTPQLWKAATGGCINKNVGGQLGWRLPAVPELLSLIDPSVAAPGPTLPPGHPFLNVQSAGYWSATTVADNPTDTYLGNFILGSVGITVKTATNHIWCVRGPMQESVY